ncbi:MAG TPA: PASTA domain-containing protein [Gaiellaceae bacterium]|jgi:hypothetical protein
MPHPAIRVVLSMTGAVCVTLITSALDTSPTVRLIGAALGAAVPALFNVGGPHGVAAGLGVTAAVLGVTYSGFLAADVAADRPLTFPAPAKVQEQVANGSDSSSPTGTAEQVEVPDLDGQPYADAQEALVDAGLVVELEVVAAEGEEPGTVVGQDPSPGEHVDAGARVQLSIAGSELPDVHAQQSDQAATELQNRGFEVSITTTEVDSAEEDGLVVDQEPDAGLALPGASVALTVGAFVTPVTTEP